jgi:hypothetical protein
MMLARHKKLLGEWSSATRTTFLKVTVLLMMFASGAMLPAHPLEVTFTPILGYGAPLAPEGIGIIGTEFPVTDQGIVAINKVMLGTVGFIFTDGRRHSDTVSFPYSDQHLNGFTVNNRLRMTVERGPVFSGTPSYFQVVNVDPSSSGPVIATASQPYVGIVYRVDTNTAGAMVAFQQSPNRIFRLTADGIETTLPIDPVAFGTSLGLSKPKILENGDIYLAVQNNVANRTEIWRVPALQPTAHLVVFSAPNTGDGLLTWDVNESGDLVVAQQSGTQAYLRRVLTNGSSQVVDGSQIGSSGSPGHYSDAFINAAGLVAAVRHGGGAGSQLVYAPAGAAAEPVLATGATMNGGRIDGLSSASSLNEAGQLTVFLSLNVMPPETSYPSRSLVVRVDLPGTSPDNPILPEPCLQGWCFPGGIPFPPRTWWYDPDVAIGYDYVAASAVFMGVEIPLPYGEGKFDLFLWNQSLGQYVDTGHDVTAGEFFSFERVGMPTGVARFSLRGIEAAAAVDPANPRGFVTGLRMEGATSDYRFSMTPLLADGPAPMWPFTGFFTPVDNAPVVNSAKAGQGVPVKFKLGGNRGLDIFAPGSPSSRAVSCSTLSASTDALEEVTSGNVSGVQYDASIDQYTYVWRTSAGWKNSCRILLITLKDGSEHEAHFRFR